MSSPDERVIKTITTHEAEQRNKNIEQVRNSLNYVYDATTKDEISEYQLDEDFSPATALEFRRFYERNGGWRFEATGLPVIGGLDGFVAKSC